MLNIYYCPSCGQKLSEDSFICPNCHLDIGELFGKDILLSDNEEGRSVELFDGSLESEVIDAHDLSIGDGDEIVIVVPQSDDDEITIDFDELGIDVESLGDNVNIVIEVDGAEDGPDILDDEDFIQEPNQWFFDDDPYGIVYYEFVDDEE